MNSDNTTARQSSEDDKRGLGDRIRSLFSKSPKTTEDMVAIIDAASDNELIDNDAKRIIEGALEVSEKQTREVMIPRTQMVVIEATASFAETLEKIIASGHSRYPVTGESMDDILGILLSKDLLKVMAGSAGEETTVANGINSIADISELLRPATFVPESKRLNVLLKQFRQDRNHMALVIDEYGSVAGLITIEDVLEEIVGEIEDEHDHEENQQIRRISNALYLVNALTPLDEFNRHFGSDIDNDEYETIGGFVINLFGHLPKRNETTEHGNFRFEVTQSDGRRLVMMRVTIKEPSSEEDSDNG